MIDSGAEVNVLGPDLAEKLEAQRIDGSTVMLQGCGGDAPTSHWVMLSLALVTGQTLLVPFVVLPKLRAMMILGAPTLDAIGGVLDYPRSLLKTSAGNIHLIRRSGPAPPPVRVLKVAVATPLGEDDQKLLDKAVESAQVLEAERGELRRILLEFSDLWRESRRGETVLVEHDIIVDTPYPIRQAPRRHSPEAQRIIDEQVQAMLKDNVIVPSSSCHVSEITLVRKKNTTEKRFCIDFRKVNEHTVPDQYPIPMIRDLVRQVRDSRYFIALDLRSGYWQVPMAKRAQSLTAFRARDGLYEFRVMPFGLKNAPATFCRLMGKVLSDLYWDGVEVYLDDILIHAKTASRVLALFRIVLQRLRAAGLTLGLKKCNFFPKKLLYLGYVFDEEGMKPNQDKVAALRQIRNPANVKELRGLIGLLSYFRMFIPNFAEVAEPMTRLLRRGTPFVWTEECTKAREVLTDALVHATLTNPLDGDELRVETDASDIAIAAILSCKRPTEEIWRSVEFLGKILSDAERRWPAHEREMWAVVYALRKWECYLKGRKVQLLTDNKSLTWMRSASRGKVARWAMSLAEYDLDVRHRSGAKNLAADYLSRYVPHDPSEDFPDRAFVSPAGVKAVDSLLGEVLQQQQAEPPPASTQGISWHEGVAYHLGRVWVPPSMRIKVVELAHNVSTVYHPGGRRTAAGIRKLYSWPGLTVDAARYVKGCLPCQRVRTGRETLQGLVKPHQTDGPFRKVYMDITVVRFNGRELNILSMIDHHTKWAEAAVLPDQTSASVAHAFLTQWVCRFGVPVTVVTDNGATFTSRLIEDLSALLGAQQRFAIAYHPDGNSPAERFHQTVIRGFAMAARSAARSRLTPEEVLAYALYGYRISVHSAVGDSPAFLTLGFDPLPPIPGLYGRCLPDNEERRRFLEDIRTTLIVRAQMAARARYQRLAATRLQLPLRSGDLILLPAERQRLAQCVIDRDGRKLHPKFSMPFRVLSMAPDGLSGSAYCLVPSATNRYERREFSIQDARPIEPPMTDLQRRQWQDAVEAFASDRGETDAAKDFVIRRFWTNLQHAQFPANDFGYTLQDESPPAKTAEKLESRKRRRLHD